MALITFGDEFVKVLILGGPNRFKAEVVDDQEIGLDQGLEATLKSVGGVGCLVRISDKVILTYLYEFHFYDTGYFIKMHNVKIVFLICLDKKHKILIRTSS